VVEEEKDLQDAKFQKEIEDEIMNKKV